MCAYPIFCLLCSCSLLFFTYCRSFSPCWPLALFLIFSPSLWIFMFFFLQNSSLLFPITRSSSFSVIHVSVNIKNNVEKDTTLLLFFLFKSPGGHAISFQIKPWVVFQLPYLLIELFYIGIPVVRMLGWSAGRSVSVRSRDYQIFSDGQFTTFSSRARAPLLKWKGLVFHWCLYNK